MYVLWKTKKKNTLAVTTEFVSCPVDTRVHIHRYTITRRIHKSIYTREKKIQVLIYIFSFFLFFFVIRKQITTQGELQNDIHTQTYTDTHRENTFGFHCIRLYCIRRLYINFPRNARFRQIIFYRSERKSVL